MSGRRTRQYVALHFVGGIGLAAVLITLSETVIEPLVDPLVHEPTRLQLCGILAAVDAAEFGTLRDTLGIADPVTSKHLKVLGTPGCVRLSKHHPLVGRPRTWVELTPRGREAFAAHVAELRRLASITAAE